MAKQREALLSLVLLAGGAIFGLLAFTSNLRSSQVEQPSVLYSRPALPPHWHKSTDSHGKAYYWNRVLATSSWTPPNADGTVADDSEEDTASVSIGDSQANSADVEVDPIATNQDNAADAVSGPGSVMSSLQKSTPEYQVTNTGDDESFADGDSGGWDLSSEAQAADPSQDESFDAASARAADWNYAAEAAAEPSFDASSPIKLHPVQKLATPADNTAGADDDEEKEISDITGYPDWPSDLPGAYGDDTSWIVGEHREPLWSDSMTNACGLTTPCEKGRADRSHAFQKTVNPFTDKRRTFDPYAQATEEGRADYPWDPSKDPKYYGKVDCSDGDLRDECFEKPTRDELDKKKQEWKRKYDEWYTGKVVGEGEEDSDGPESVDASHKAASTPLLTAPKDLTPWARSDIPGLGRKAANGHFAGGEPVAKSFGSVVRKVEGELSEGVQSLSFKSLRDWGHKFLRARQGRHPALTEEEGQMLAQMAAAAHESKVAKEGGEGKASAVAGKEENGAHESIWESPLEVVKRGLFGEPSAAAPGSKAGEQTAAASEAAKALKRKLAKDGGKGKGPLPPALADAVKVTESGEGKGKAAAAAAAGKKVSGWEAKVMQQGAMRAESAEKSMEDALRARDHKMLKAADGLSWAKLKSLQAAATDLEKDMTGGKAVKQKKAKGQQAGVKGWEEKEMQQGAMRHESVEENLREALGRRELGLLEHRAGWKSTGELHRALAFADNLEAAIKSRRQEEAHHPLMPKAAKKALHLSASKKEEGAGEGEDLTAQREHHKELKAEAREAADRRVVQRVREEAPIVRAYEAQVRDDEQEYEGEMAEERMTLSKLHRDQGRLTHAIAAEEGTAKAHGKAKKASAGLSADASLTKLRSLASGSGKMGKKEVAPEHGMSAAQADKDLDSFFAKEGGQ